MGVGFVVWCIAFIALAYLVYRLLPKANPGSWSSSSSGAVEVIAREEGKDGGGRASADVYVDRFSNQSVAITTNENSKQHQASTVENDKNGGWKCVCEGGGIGLFLPPSLMKSMGGPGAAMRLGAGGCYHKQM